MRILSKLTIASLKRNKRRSIVTMIGVALSAALIFTVIAIPLSYRESSKNYQKTVYGDFHQVFENVPSTALSIVENDEDVESYYYSRPVTPSLDYIYLFDEESEDPLPTELYMRLDSLTEQERASGDLFDIYVRYKRPQAHKFITRDIESGLKQAGANELHMRTNKELLSYEGDIDYNTAAIVFCFGALIIGILMIASIFTIRNSFNISTTERTREFGALSSVGATPRQIRRTVVLEACCIGLFAIPAGIILGIVATLILLFITNTLLDLGEVVMSFSAPWWLFVADAILGFLVVWLSSASAAIRASRLSPIEAIRSSQDIKVKAKRLKTSKFIRAYFGVGGVVASKNLKRSRQKYRTAVISIVVSVAVFVGLSSFVIDGKRIINKLYPNVGADYVINGATMEDYRKIINRFDMHDYVIYRDVAASNGYVMSVLSSEYFEKYARSVGIRDDFEHAVILNDYVKTYHANGSISLAHVTGYHEGDSLELEMSDPLDYENDGTVNLTITKNTDRQPMGTVEVYAPMIFVSENYYQRDKLIFASEYTSLYVNPGDYAEELTKYIVELNVERVETGDIISYYDVRASLRQVNNLLLLLSIFMYGFIAVVALIGVTNIFNTITTNMLLRSREFAMLKSVGMTDDEFNRMIRLESILYSLRALAIGLPIGIIISVGAHFFLSAGGIDLDYELPLLPIVISIAVVGLMVTVIMRYSVRQISRQNIIDTIRQEVL